MSAKNKLLKDYNELQKFIILLTGAADNKPIKGSIKLQKILFMLSNGIDGIREGAFDAHLYGPFSKTIDQELQYLGQIGVLGNIHGEITLTETGREIAKDMAKDDTTRDILEILTEYKETFNNLTDKELLTYVYLAYPDAAKASADYEHLRSNMEDHIISMVKKHKITAQRAAELLKKPLPYVMKRMKEEGIQFWDEF